MALVPRLQHPAPGNEQFLCVLLASLVVATEEEHALTEEVQAFSGGAREARQSPPAQAAKGVIEHLQDRGQ